MNVSQLQSVVEALGWTLVHFLWQGVLIAFAFALALRLTGAASSRLRYRATLALFLCAGLAPLVTFWMIFESPAGAAAPLGGTLVVGAAGVAGDAGTPWWPALESALEPYLPWAVALWLAGVIVMSGRVCMDWWQVRRLTWVGVDPLPRHWEERVAELMRTFGVSRPVRVMRSTIVRVPAVIGWLRPVILLPTAALAGLSARQLELIIAHELAHIRRADYLVNLLQVVIETVLFYHPAVRWMSNRLREERELCCDDAVIGTCGDTLTYAQALAELEAQRQRGFQTALAASGGHLSQRIYRMLDRPVPRRNTLVWSMSLVIGLAAGSVALATQVAITGTGRPVPVGAEPRVQSAVTAPAEVPTRSPLASAATAPEAEALRTVSRSRATEPDAVEARPGAARETPARPEPAVASAGKPQSVAEETEPVASAPEQAGDAKASPEAAGARPEAVAAASEASAADDAGTAPAEPAASGGVTADAGQDAAPAGNGQPATQGEPLRLAAATPPPSKAAEPPRPEVRGGEALHVTAPEYPRRARMRGLQGSVTAEFTIDRDGRVRDIEITDSAPAGVFDRAVNEAVGEWRFRPLLKDGEAIARRVSKQFEFNLAGGKKSEDEATEDNCDPVTGTRICRPWLAAPGEELPQ